MGLYAVVFCSRYIDLLWNFSSMYNWILKIGFIGASVAIVYFMRYGAPQKATYNAEQDAFPIQKLGEVENLTSHYVFALGAYRGLYLLNWIYRYMTEDDYVQRIVWIAGVVQTGLYCDFF